MDPYAYQTFRVIYEATSAIICFILVRYMIKPYQITRESRYLGLPLGFGFLGATYALSSFVYFQPYFFGNRTIYFQLVVRTLAFVFLCVTYFFSRRSGDSRRLWNTTIALLIIAFLASFLLVIIPDIALPNYQLTSSFTRILNLMCIVYLCVHTLRSHLEKPDPKTLWTPFGYFLLGISQYSLLVWAIEGGDLAFYGGLALRWIGLIIFLSVSYRSFHNSHRKES